MTRAQTDQGLRIFAPAKINLNLHVTGKREDGYHTLDSLVGFVDVGDQITLMPAPAFRFTIDGPFADNFSAAERAASANSVNLVVRAAHLLAAKLNRAPDVALTLTKTLPLGAGLGGGSADAAATLWGLMELWGVAPHVLPGLDDLMLSLGADVPVCWPCRTIIMRGIGEKLSPAPAIGEWPIVLINPGESCSTATIFKRYDGPYRPHITWPDSFDRRDDFIAFLNRQHNDLTAEACALVPVIGDILAILEKLPGCRIARMSGSGATCFALFADETAAQEAAARLRRDHPAWWITSATLGRPHRY